MTVRVGRIVGASRRSGWIGVGVAVLLLAAPIAGGADPVDRRAVAGAESGPPVVRTPAGRLAGAPDGTLFVATDDGVVQVGPTGVVTDLPGMVATDQVAGVLDLAVDEHGRLFLATGNLYDGRGFKVTEPLAARGPRVWYRSMGDESIDALAAGGDTVQILTTDARQRVLVLDRPGRTTERSVGPDHLVDVAVDGAGATVAVGLGADGGATLVVLGAGGRREVTIPGRSGPFALAVGADGTVYVADELGLHAIDGIAAPADGSTTSTTTNGPARPVAPGAPAPLLPGIAAYTG